MKASQTIRRIQKEQIKLQKSGVEHILAKPNPKNIFEWHFVIHGLKDTLFTGFYHGILLLPTEYPLKPPSIMFITPNGRFKPHEKICLSFTNYHPESWSAAWDIEKMLIAMVSFMMTEEATTGMIRCSNSDRKRFAKLSVLNNIKNPQFVQLFKDDFGKSLDINPNILNDISAYEQSLYNEVGGIQLQTQDSMKIMFFVGSFLAVIISYLFLKNMQIL